MKNNDFQNIYEIHQLAIKVVNDLFWISGWFCRLENSKEKNYFFSQSEEGFSECITQWISHLELLENQLDSLEPVFANVHFDRIGTDSFPATSWHSFTVLFSHQYKKQLSSYYHTFKGESMSGFADDVMDQIRKKFFGGESLFSEHLPKINDLSEADLLYHLKGEFNEVMTHLSLKVEKDQIDNLELDVYEVTKTKCLYQFMSDQKSEILSEEFKQSPVGKPVELKDEKVQSIQNSKIVKNEETINEKLIKLAMDDQRCIDMPASQLASLLGCTPPAITKTTAWKMYMKERNNNAAIQKEKSNKEFLSSDKFNQVEKWDQEEIEY